MSRKKPTHEILNLDSLVDIVSNNVGILVILAVFMAIISLYTPPQEDTASEEKSTQESTKKIIIPWSHNSQKSSILFAIRKNRLVYLDRYPLYQQLKAQLSQTASPSNSIKLEEVTIKLTPITSYSHCIEFFIRPNAGKWWPQLIRDNGKLSQLLAENSPNENYFFFWVDAGSFELFTEIRHYLQERHFEVGWKPITENSPLHYCTDISRSKSFQPQ
ncbi:hypothetical protein WDW89_19540 [Deltaproteobacteria bacterium TL4]